jgi:signal transduction histidine kinase
LKLPVYDFIFYILKKTGLLLVVLTLFSSLLQGQHVKIDSLKTLLKSKEGIDRYDPLISLVREYASIDNNTTLSYANEARRLAFEFGDSSKIVNSSRIIGQLLNRLDRTLEAEEILLATLPIAKRNNFRSEYKNLLSNLAVAYTVQAKYDKALDINFQTLILREEDHNDQEITVSLNNIGLVYFKLKNSEKALEYYSRALELKKKIKDTDFVDRLLINIGLCYNSLNNYAKAQEYFYRAFDTCGDNCNEQIQMTGQLGLGVSNFGMGNFSEASDNFNRSLAIAQRINNKRFQAENLLSLARIYLLEKNNDEGVKALKECEVICIESGYNEILIEVYKEFSRFFKKLNDFEQTSHYQNRYINLKDSIYSENLIDNLAKIQTNYAERENIKTIAANEEIIQRQRSLNIAIVIIAILASLLVFVLYRSNRVKKKVNAALSEAKAIIEDQNKQLLNSNIHLNEELKEKNIDLEIANESLRRVNDELDNFIYKTSHDIRGPLASLKGMCNVALMDVHDPVALDYLHKLDITADKLNSILTRLLIVNQINNSTIGHELIDFNGIVTDVLLLEKKKGLPPKFVIRKKIENDIEFHSDKEFVRIILENLIDNAIKFYNDSPRVEPFVDITISLANDYVLIRVVDNGIGISEVQPDKIFQMFSRASERSETGGIGLYITKTAVQKLGGLIDLRTNPEGNTEFFIKLPVVMSKVIA